MVKYIEHSPYPGLIVVFVSLRVENKRKSTSTVMVGKTQKLDGVVDGKFPDDLDSASIFREVIGHKLSDGSSDDLYLRCRMNSADDVDQTQKPESMDLGLLAINTLNESGFLGNIATRILRPMDGYH